MNRHKITALSSITLLLVVSCNLPATVTPTPSTETPIIPASPTADASSLVTLNNASFTIPLGVANDALSEMVSAVPETEGGPWGVAPAHLKFTLTGYHLQNTFHEPQIYVYPADEFAKINPAAVEQIERLKAILAGSSLSKDAMPGVPFFNAGSLMAAKTQLIDFQNGHGVRRLDQYAQYFAPINNHELIYHFQGLTNNGSYYIIAILPVASSILAEDDKPESPVPAGGIPFPPTTGPDPAYYDAVTKALDAMYEDSFNPSLFQLDTLIKSLIVTP